MSTARLWSSLTACGSVRQTVCVATETAKTEVWQARIGHDLAASLRDDAKLLGLNGRTDIVREALMLLHRRAAEERMARSVDEFYGDQAPPLPVGVRSGSNAVGRRRRSG